MNVNATMKVGALFKLDVYKEIGEAPVKSLDWFANTMLDQGLKHLSGNSGYSFAIGYVAVGSGTSIPVASQTGLDTYVASANTVIANAGGRNMSEKYAFGRKTFRFARGAAAGILGELCLCELLSTGPDKIFAINRGRIKDALGEPTTLEVLSDEFLEVTVEFRTYFQEIISGTFKLMKGSVQVSEHTVTGRCCLTGDPSSFYISPCALDYNRSSIISPNPLPAGNSAQPSGGEGFVTKPSYADGKVYGSMQVGLDFGNGYDHKSFFVPICNILNDGASNGYMWEITPPIRKTGSQEITYNLNITWQRYEGA
ncbi:hypothetical protein BEN74_18825 [Acinetobacter sp. WCHAc010034]|uniref:hypothetical protein n=1 Tax=Acinetobacter sp. WCHAc010034 TaxID=1879049 RepID=UPI00083A353D|nr:hypothetical protein [Acinetobacter sp. WCHAc010034]AYA04635.1 hypothetical protein BEN74_18825 [Acinetobacter sp. WCHAc010034]